MMYHLVFTFETAAERDRVIAALSGAVGYQAPVGASTFYMDNGWLTRPLEASAARARSTAPLPGQLSLGLGDSDER